MLRMKRVLKNRYAQAVMGGLTACVIGVILAMGCWLLWQNAAAPLIAQERDFRPLILAAVLAALWFGLKAKTKKKLSPIALIAVSAVSGILIYSF